MPLPADSGPDERHRDIRALTDPSLSSLEERDLVAELITRVLQVFTADTAAIWLLDPAAGQLVTTAAAGLEDEVRQEVGIPVGRGFVGRIAAEQRPLVLDHIDEATVLNPVLHAKGVRSLVGAPMMTGGRVVGVIHVGSVNDRVFTSQDAELLQVAADRAAAAVQSLVAMEDRRAAAALQRSLVPAALPEHPGVELAARYIPGTGTVGGDWYDVLRLPSGELGLVMGDVAGSGLPAAVVMGRMRSALRAYALQTSDPAEVLARLDRKMQYFEPGVMATILYVVLARDLASMRISSAGHLPPVCAAPGRPAEVLSPHQDLLIGVDAGTTRHVVTLGLAPGSVLCCYTDGLVERPGEMIDAGIARLRDSLAAMSAEVASAAVMHALVGGVAPRDDIALLVLRRT
ncbi:MAG TPA: GAF domain-containing SpoIIE family protein phosphatase [Streptosporangiaceae bacterium]